MQWASGQQPASHHLLRRHQGQGRSVALQLVAGSNGGVHMLAWVCNPTLLMHIVNHEQYLQLAAQLIKDLQCGAIGVLLQPNHVLHRSSSHMLSKCIVVMAALAPLQVVYELRHYQLHPGYGTTPKVLDALAEGWVHSNQTASLLAATDGVPDWHMLHPRACAYLHSWTLKVSGPCDEKSMYSMCPPQAMSGTCTCHLTARTPL